MKGTSDHLPNLENLTSVKKTPGSPQPVHESKSESKKVTKPKPKKRPFGSIRCRAVRLTHMFAARAMRTYRALSCQHILCGIIQKIVCFLSSAIGMA